MGVVRDSPRSIVAKTCSELNELNDLLSSDTDGHQFVEDLQVTRECRRVRRKRKSSNRQQGQMYSCRKSTDVFLKELSAELGIDTELQDILPHHNSPLSSLFDDPAKMKLWLVFIDSNQEEQDNMLHPEVELDCQRRYKKISKSLRAELEDIPVETIKQFEEAIYSTVKDMGYEGVVLFTANLQAERVVIVAVSQYSRLRSVSHQPISVVEVQLRKKKFVEPVVLLSEIMQL